MKVRELLQNIENYRKIYSDIDEWEIYTEQPSLIAPLDNTSYEDYFNDTKLKNDNEEYKELKSSYEIIKQLEKQGWKFVYDSEGWVYRETNDEHCNHTLFPENKIITINNNY